MAKLGECEFYNIAPPRGAKRILFGWERINAMAMGWADRASLTFCA